MKIDKQIILGMMKHVCNEDNLLITSDGIVEIDPERLLNAQIRKARTKLSPDFTCDMDRTKS